MHGVWRVNKVTTTSTCGRCGVPEVREGALYSTPDGWARGELIRWGHGNDTWVFNDDLCPACQDAVMAVLEPTRKDTCAAWSAAVAVCKNCGGAFNDHQPRIQAEAPDAD